ncbi:5-carboxymethyl-2-hydroxymuconate Delta-isomerase [Pseudogracilibacillus sp. SO30301A]|uniref:5-carboxymethyl-2-hydroxymuconate Delta-isomerase n=1 Tax=Pseudogracilibacillus sp. SO30301A TaxID=3098291 RepID=UPI00300E2D10
MPHLTFEYTDNIKEVSDIPTLLKKANDTLLQHQDVIPIGGLRTRAIELKDYCVADGSEDDAFVHVILKLGSGRTDGEIKRVCDDLFKTVKDHFAEIFENRYLALSLEVHEFTRPTYKQNNIHLRYK